MVLEYYGLRIIILFCNINYFYSGNLSMLINYHKNIIY